MATIATVNTLLPPQPAFNRYSRASTHLDNQQLSERFWDAVKLDSPTSPTFDSSLHSSPIDEKVMCAIYIEDTTTTFDDDPIIAFETLDCYSPDRPSFTSTAYNDHLDDLLFDPCPYGEPPDLCCTSPAPTLGSIRYQDRFPSRAASPWSAMTLRPTRFKKTSPSPNNSRQAHSVLALASAFLDSIVRLARSRTSTPTTFNDGRGPVTILESEVLINVLEGDKRACLQGSTSLHGEEKALEKFEIPPLFAVSAGGDFWDTASPMISIEGPATCSQELDAMGKAGWGRQLTGTKAHGFDAEMVYRGRDV